MLKIDKSFVVIEALKAAYKVIKEERLEAKYLATSKLKVTEDGNVDLLFESEELSFFIKVDYDSSQIPDRVQEIFPCPYGELVTWGEDDVNNCFAEGSDLMRDYEGFLLLDENKGFHIEAKALYNESDYEPVENMF